MSDGWSTWGNGPGDTYAAHSHPYTKRLQCVQGSIVFHLPTGDVTLTVGDELVVDRGTLHSATVGPDGVRCRERHS